MVPDLGKYSIVNLKDISMPIEYGLGASAIDYDGKNIYVRITDIDDETSQFDFDKISSPSFLESKYLLNDGDILVARTGASVGKSYLHYNMQNSYFAGFLMRIRVSGHYPYFIYSQLKTNKFKKWLQIMSIRSGQPGINSKELGLFKIRVTDVKNEEKIGNIIKCIDQRIITQKKIIGDLESLRNKINTDIYNKIDFNKKCKLKELCSITTGKLDANAMVVNGKYRFYTCAEKFYYINNYDFDGEALLISGNGANVGYIHYYNGKFNAYQRTYVLQNFKLNAKYINVFLNVFLKHRIEQQKNNGNTPYIKMATLAEMTILIPSIEEQNNIISINDLLNKKISNEKKILSLYEKQKQYLLNKLFI